MGRAAQGALRSWGLDQGVDASHGVGAQHDPGGVAIGCAAGFRCPERPSKLDPFKDEIHELLREDPTLPGVRVRELIEPLGFDGGKTIVDDYLREVRPLFLRAADVSADGLSAGRDLPVGSVGALQAGPGRSRPDRAGRGSWCACLGIPGRALAR